MDNTNVKKMIGQNRSGNDMNDELVNEGDYGLQYETTEDQDDGSYYYDNLLKLYFDRAVPYEKFWARIMFDKTKVSYNSSVERIYLVLHEKEGSYGYFSINNRPYKAGQGEYKIDVTYIFTTAGVPNQIDISPFVEDDITCTDINFYTEGGYKPTLEIISVSDVRSKPVYKTIALDDRLNAQLELRTRDVAFEIKDCKAEESVCDFALSHIFTRKVNGQEGYGYFNLSVGEQIYNYQYSDPAGYVFVDAYNRENYFKKLYYYEENGSKIYLTSTQAAQVTLNSQGKLVYGDKELTLVYRTPDGYTYFSQAPQAVTSLSVYNQMMNSEDQRDVPVYYISNGTLTKCFNRYGNLILVVNNYGNCYRMVLQNSSLVEKIIFYSNNGESQTMNLYYDSGKVSMSTGGPTLLLCSYDNDGFLESLTVGDKIFDFEYIGGRISAIETDGKRMEISYDSDGALSSISTFSVLTAIPSGQTNTLKPLISKIDVDTLTRTTKLTDKEGNSEYYVFDLYDKLTDYFIETNGKVSHAEKYLYESNERFKVKYAKKSTLNQTAYSNYVFEEDVINTVEYDGGGRKTSEQTENVSIPGGNKITVGSSYLYNSSGQISQVESFKRYNISPSGFFEVNYKSDYFYDNDGRLDYKREEYIDDLFGNDLLSNSIIEDYDYDSYGHVTGVSRYLNVTPSSGNPKLKNHINYEGYGRVLSRASELAENEYEYSYLDDGLPRHLITPFTVPSASGNNSENIQYSYWYTSRNDLWYMRISNSTANGHQNNIEYSNGEVTGCYSGTIGDRVRLDYVYDDKRRIKTVKLNDEEYLSFAYSENDVSRTTTVTNAKDEVMSVTEAKDGSYSIASYGDDDLYKCTYRADGMLSGEIDYTCGEEVLYSYDENGSITAYTRKKNGVQVYGESYSYNGWGELQSITTTDSSGNSSVHSYTNKGLYKRRADSESAISGTQLVYDIDWFDRPEKLILKESGNAIDTIDITYKTVVAETSTMPSEVKYTGAQGVERLIYSYNAGRNITNISDGTKSIAYEYDGSNRLHKETNAFLGKTYEYSYDAHGNILTKKVNNTTISYVYDGMQLKSYNGQSCVYDEVGNPTTYRGKSAVWAKGRQLMSYNGTTFTYDGKGRRRSKNSLTFTYDSQDRVIATSNGLKFFYDNFGVAGMVYNNAKYHFRRDIQGNIIAILDTNGNVVVKYNYDAWGNHIISGSNVSLGALNPFRYRGYYYDTETGFYFLQTRYYDPEVGRFINQDSISYADPQTINGLNLYAYCLNNPVMYTDPSGHFAILIALILGAFSVAGMVTAGVVASSQGESGWELFGQIVTGGFIGLAIGGLFVATVGAAAAIFGSSGLATSVLGVTAKQAFALGALAYDFVAMVVAPIIGIEMEPIEWGNPSYEPQKPGKTPVHPSEMRLSVYNLF